MRKLIVVLSSFLFAFALILGAGCSKKEEPAKPPAETAKPAEPEKKAEEAKPGGVAKPGEPAKPGETTPPPAAPAPAPEKK